MNLEFRYTADGLIPAIVQEAQSPCRVLMMAWMNRESIDKTLETGLMHYWSRTRQKLWLKGETSGHTQRLVRWFCDCDGDTLLFEVEQKVGACHTGHRSCFFQELDLHGESKPILEPKVFDARQAYSSAARPEPQPARLRKGYVVAAVAGSPMIPMAQSRQGRAEAKRRRPRPRS